MGVVTGFQAHVELLRLFLAHREDIAGSIDAVLNAQRKPIEYLQDRSLLSRRFEDCFFAQTRPDRLSDPKQLEEAHWAAGFKPRQVQHAHNDLIHPVEMTMRAFHLWQQTQWPGRNGRMHYAQTLFNLYVLRYLELLSMRLWDEDPGSAGPRLAEIQAVLDELWKSSPADQPVFVRDARWLIPLAQSLITDELAPYLEVSGQVTDTLQEADRLEIRKAHVRMLGGHLTSQIRYYCTKDDVSIDEHSVVLRTRTSNALDFALLVAGLVPLLKAYDRAVESGDERMRIEMAGAICQGISADPELFVNRVDLLSAYSMIEHVFIGRDREDSAVYSPLGKRHVELLKEYGALIDRLAGSLHDDAQRFRPVDGGFSPYGVIFGLPSHLIEHMALKALQHDAEIRFSLEDVFADCGTGDGGASMAKLAWVNGWRKLPHIDPEVQRVYDYPQQFAEDIYGRIERELGRRELGRRELGRRELGQRASKKTGRLYIMSADVPELPARYIVSSDRQIVAAQKAEHCDRAQLLRDRKEGHFLVSYETRGGWNAIRKDLLSEVLGAGGDARIAGLPLDAARVLQLMCGDLAIPAAG